MTAIALGLRENWRQFSLLVLINAFVGGMVGLERTVVPLIGSEEFKIASTTLVVSFIVSFGVIKALANLVSGQLADVWGRKRVLVIGWLFGLPVPFIVMWAPSWEWVVAANALLGLNQGFAWSMTVIMKIDLVGPRRRGFAMGINECAGYAAVAGAGIVSAIAAGHYGLRAGAAYPGVIIAALGLLFSWFVRDTGDHVRLEASQRTASSAGDATPPLSTILRRSMWSDAGLFSLSQAGFVNNLNDGLAWGVFPLVFTASGLTLGETSILAAIYPATWSICQLATGPLSDRWGRPKPIVGGMLLQGVALIAMTIVTGFGPWAAALALLGVGTALVYPALLAAVGDVAHPSWRGVAVGVYRLWRDLGYVAGALLAGFLADAFGIPFAIDVIGVITMVSGIVVAIRLREPSVRLAEAVPTA